MTRRWCFVYPAHAVRSRQMGMIQLATGTELTEICPGCHYHLGVAKDAEKLAENVLSLYLTEPDHCLPAGASVMHIGVARSKVNL